MVGFALFVRKAMTMQRNIIINFILFQITWFACVLGAAQQLPWLGVLLVLAAVAWHLHIATEKLVELKLLLCALLIGGLFDQMMLNSHLISYESHGWSGNIVPVWILALWLGFTTTLNVSLRWIRGKWFVAVIFGLVGGPLAYMGAVKLGAVTLNQMPQTYLALAIGWSLLTPLLVKLAIYFDGFKPRTLQ